MARLLRTQIDRGNELCFWHWGLIYHYRVREGWPLSPARLRELCWDWEALVLGLQGSSQAHL